MRGYLSKKAGLSEVERAPNLRELRYRRLAAGRERQRAGGRSALLSRELEPSGCRAGRRAGKLQGWNASKTGGGREIEVDRQKKTEAPGLCSAGCASRDPPEALPGS